MARKLPWSKANHLQCCSTPAVPPWSLKELQQAACQRVICFVFPIRKKTMFKEHNSQMHWDVHTQECGYCSRSFKEGAASSNPDTCRNMWKCKHSQHHDFVLTSLGVKLSLGAALWKQSCSLTQRCVILTQQPQPNTPNTPAARTTSGRDGNVI